MLAANHQARALAHEQTIADLGDPVAKPHIRPTVIEGYWGAAFHWIAYACDQKHGAHRDQHQGLVSFLRDTAHEPTIADRWRAIEDVRNAGWYGNEPLPAAVERAHDLWQDGRMAGDPHMGTELTDRTSRAAQPREEASIPVPSWLDERTAALVRAITMSLAARHSGVQAVILYGSVARHEERPLTDPAPSDVDLLVLVDLEPELDYIPYERHIALFESVGLADARYPVTPRDVQVQLGWHDLANWDSSFADSIARDGIVLWARGPLPESLAALAGTEASATG